MSSVVCASSMYRCLCMKICLFCLCTHVQCRVCYIYHVEFHFRFTHRVDSEDDLKNEDNIKNEDDIKNEDIFMQRRLYIDEAHTALDIFCFAVFFFVKLHIQLLNLTQLELNGVGVLKVSECSFYLIFLRFFRCNIFLTPFIFSLNDFLFKSNASLGLESVHPLNFFILAIYLVKYDLTRYC